jgi:hypothetical protein
LEKSLSQQTTFSIIRFSIIFAEKKIPERIIRERNFLSGGHLILFLSHNVILLTTPKERLGVEISLN